MFNRITLILMLIAQVNWAQTDDRDFEIANEMREELKEEGLFFVGIDVIAGKLIEVNVTSPTLLREIAALGGPNLAQEIIDVVFLPRS